jgi:hypothetical protein
MSTARIVLLETSDTNSSTDTPSSAPPKPYQVLFFLLIIVYAFTLFVCILEIIKVWRSKRNGNKITIVKIIFGK